MEWIVSGYCRGQDQARSILLELDGGQWYCDCDYPDSWSSVVALDHSSLNIVYVSILNGPSF